MFTAKEAHENTMQAIRKIAMEFITNNTGFPIQEAINSGKFRTSLSFDGVPNPEITGKEVVKILEEQGFKAEHVYYDNVNDYENYIIIDWE